MDEKIYRIIDANINRVTEGLRVVEDIFRYYYDSPDIQQCLKDLRHRIVSGLEPKKFIPYRRSFSDVGFASKGKLEFVREGLEDIIRSNMKRVQEGLRVLEEVFKLESNSIAMEMKKIRFKAYEMDKKILRFKEQKILRKGLYLIMTAPPTGYKELAKMAVRAGLPAIQLRYKGDNDKEHLNYALGIREATLDTDTLFIVNDRFDIALLSEADGVHLGQDDIHPARAKDVLRNNFIIGLSTHNMTQVEIAQDLPIDYIGFGPIWTTTSKEKPDPVTGIETLKHAISISRFPVVAIGGITSDRITHFSRVSCNNVAVLSAVTRAEDPYREMLNLNTRFLEGI